MEQIKFQNGSKIEIVETDDEYTRSKRGQDQFQRISEYYKHNPDKFVEEIMGIKLYPYQKIMLKLMSTQEKLFSKFGIRRRNK